RSRKQVWLGGGPAALAAIEIQVQGPLEGKREIDALTVVVDVLLNGFARPRASAGCNQRRGQPVVDSGKAEPVLPPIGDCIERSQKVSSGQSIAEVPDHHLAALGPQTFEPAYHPSGPLNHSGASELHDDTLPRLPRPLR